MIGPGRYDDVCSVLRKELQADGVVVIVINGCRGSGFSAQADAALMASRVPDALEVVAAEMRRDAGAALITVQRH